MKRWRHTTAGAGLIPLCGFVLLPLLAIAGTWFIGSRGLLTEPSPSILADSGWAALPGMGATLLPRWTLGNYDPRLEGPARGELWPVPAGISYSPDRSSTVTSFQSHAPDAPVLRLVGMRPAEGRR